MAGHPNERAMHSFQREGPHDRSPRQKDAHTGAGRLGWAWPYVPGKSSLTKFKNKQVFVANAIVLSNWLPRAGNLGLS